MQDRVAACKNALESLEGFMEDLKAHPSNWVVNSIRKTVTLDGDAGGSSVEEVVFQPLEVGAYTSALFDSCGHRAADVGDCLLEGGLLQDARHP